MKSQLSKQKVNPLLNKFHEFKFVNRKFDKSSLTIFRNGYSGSPTKE